MYVYIYIYTNIYLYTYVSSCTTPLPKAARAGTPNRSALAAQPAKTRVLIY